MDKILLKMWGYADQVYDRRLSVVTYRHDRMLVVDKPDYQVFSFAGSDDIEDWVNNFRINSLDEHKGFKESFERFKDDLIWYIRDKKEIYITGHSRGGALATFAAEYIAENICRCNCITFGTPMVGDGNYRDKYNLLPINHTHIRNGWDIVSYLPNLTYRHVGKIVRLKQPFYHRLMYYRVKDHWRISYKKAIENYYKK